MTMNVIMLDVHHDAKDGVMVLFVAPLDDSGLRPKYSREAAFYVTPLQIQQLGIKIVAWSFKIPIADDSNTNAAVGSE